MTDVTLPDGRTVDETQAGIIATLKTIWREVQDSDITIDDVFPEPS